MHTRRTSNLSNERIEGEVEPESGCEGARFMSRVRFYVGSRIDDRLPKC